MMNLKSAPRLVCSVVSSAFSRITRSGVALAFVLGGACLGLSSQAAESVRVLDGKRYHLRSADTPEWDFFEAKKPHGPRLEIRFSAEASAREATLFLYQDDVKQDWRVELNGKRLGSLFLMEAPLIHTLTIPPGGLRDGDNVLTLVPPKPNDDIMAGELQLDLRPTREALAQTTLEVRVTDAVSREPLPCRITIVNGQGALAALQAGADTSLAVRPGIVYTPDGKAQIRLPPGRYTAYATRGFEYGLAATNVSLAINETRRIDLQLTREVATPGFVSCDTHVHTFTHSRHGDAIIEERVVTLAGEGIELPIATDHEYLADYTEAAAKTGVSRYFTPVIGCETTTAKGHFNSFPIASGSRVPDPRVVDWPRLMQSIRSNPDVRVVVLNHPRNIHSNFQPFASTNFNAVTGENKRGFEFSFDAIEVANSSALQSDLRLGFYDWLALLNYGYRVTAVGSSDGHDVSRYIVGQGRSYVQCEDRDPARINVAGACESFLKGRVLVSLGLLTQLRVDGKFNVGDLAVGVGDQIRIEATVLGPSWVNADLVELFANGVKIREQGIEANRRKPGAGIESGGLKARVSWTIPRPKHDVHLVAIASGPGVSEPYWAIARPYQPSSPVWKPRVLGATNPIWIDADGDGKFTSARAYAQALVERHGPVPDKLLPALGGYDEAIAAQAASLMHRAGIQFLDAEVERELREASHATQRGIKAFLGTVSRD
ncbi:MAG: CehA/McbA family metallohydrolase [Verrucomicrobia bacterium]|nr:CehA/McbA family metallohydrolase [Verrucomicrobiota bacterium]